MTLGWPTDEKLIGNENFEKFLATTPRLTKLVLDNCIKPFGADLSFWTQLKNLEHLTLDVSQVLSVDVSQAQSEWSEPHHPLAVVKQLEKLDTFALTARSTPTATLWGFLDNKSATGPL